MFSKLWKDEDGIVALEYLLVATIVGLGLVVGLSNLSNALNAELSELANAILGLSQAYSVSTKSGCSSSKQGSAVSDDPGSVTFTTASVTATSVNVTACP